MSRGDRPDTDVVLRARGAWALTVAVWAIVSGLSVMAAAENGFWSFLRLAPAYAAAALLAWMVFASPRIRIDRDRLTIRNVLRTTSIPWCRIRAVDVETSLRVTLDDGRRVRAWAASSNRTQVSSLPALMADERLRMSQALPSDDRAGTMDRVLGRTEQGPAEAASAADVVSRMWIERKDAPSQEMTTVRFRTWSVVAFGALIVAAILLPIL